ncbi:MAG: transporter [Desulforegulaceae bacterium]|nr:transporter [Desulforegulaceae bacterium]
MATKLQLATKKLPFFYLIILLFILLPVYSNLNADEIDRKNSPEIKERLEKLEQLLLEIEKKQKASEVMSELKQTDEEKKQKDEDILDAAGREYTLATPGLLNISYSISYTGDTYDQLQSVEDENGRTSTMVKHLNSHKLSNSLSFKVPILKNLTLSSNIPFSYEYIDSQKGSKNGSGIGDPSFNIQYQPFKPREGIPTTILNAGIIVPLGDNPYKMDGDDEVAIGNGYYTVFAGANFSKSIDPVIAFGGISFYKNMDVDDAKYNTDKEQKEQGIYIEKVSPGNQISANLGMGYSLSYLVSVSVGFQYTYSYSTDYYWRNIGKSTSPTSYSSSLSIGTNWRISSTRSVNTSLNIGLFNSNSDVSFSLSIPFDFKL